MPVEFQTSFCSSSNHILFILLLYFSTFTYQQACHVGDQQSLLDLAASFSSSLPLNWTSDSDCCSSWEGIGCDATGRVSRLWLPARGLNGNISSSLGRIASLTQLNLSQNSIGFLPDDLFTSLNSLEIIDLSSNYMYCNVTEYFSSNFSFPATIQVVDLSSNNFHGEIEPAWFALASHLSSFNASNNYFYGQIPSSICMSCPELKKLDFTNADFSGQIPAGLGRCSKLQVLWAGFNYLSGPLPDDIYSLKLLVELSVPENNINGTIGEEMTGLTNLRSIDLSSNSFSGTIPRDIGKLSNLKQLQLHTNKLSGTIPPSLMNCTNIEKLILRGNAFQGNISMFDFSKLVRLHTLDLGENNFAGNIPETAFSCKSLTAIRLTSNNLTGQISPKILSLTSLSFLALANNDFTKVSEAITILARCKNLATLALSGNFNHELLPTEKGFIAAEGFRNLKLLALGGCNFRGKVPEWLASIKNLQVLDLSYNKLTGTIPECLGTLPSFFYLDLSMNDLTGRLPLQLNRLPAIISYTAESKLDPICPQLPVYVVARLTRNQNYNELRVFPTLFLKGNQLTGVIPVGISQLQNLYALDLSENQLSGSIPPELSNLTSLEVLDLSQNKLTGQIPAKLQTLKLISVFNVSYNNLEGPIPTDYMSDIFTKYNYIGNPRLCGEILQTSCSQNLDSGILSTEPAITGSQYKKHFLDGFTIGVGTFFIAVIAIQAYRLRKILFHRKRK